MIDINPHIPSHEDVVGADLALRALDAASGAPVLVHIAGTSDTTGVALPPEARTLLLRILGAMANGDAVAVIPVQAEVTAQQAAEILGVSRPFLIRLIDEGKVACRKVGTHRRIPLSDLMFFKQANKAERRAIAAELTAEAQDLEFGY